MRPMGDDPIRKRIILERAYAGRCEGNHQGLLRGTGTEQLAKMIRYRSSARVVDHGRVTENDDSLRNDALRGFEIGCVQLEDPANADADCTVFDLRGQKSGSDSADGDRKGHNRTQNDDDAASLPLAHSLLATLAQRSHAASFASTGVAPKLETTSCGW